MNIGVVGLWHLGLVTAACLATEGHSVIAFDDEQQIITELQHGRLPIYEPGLDEVVHAAMTAGSLRFVSSASELMTAELVWITYDTPVDDDDRADTTAVMHHIEALFPYLGANAILIISSQLPVGSTRVVEQAYRRLVPGGTAGFVYLPENLRLGQAIGSFTKPDRVVIGIREDSDKGKLVDLLAPYTDNIEWMSVESAEMTKHALNAWLATSVAFINEVAAICEHVGADARDVERGLKTDMRIGSKAYLRPGSAFAGGTLARELTFLAELADHRRVPLHLLPSVSQSNTFHRTWTTRRLGEILAPIRGQKVALLGLTYKPGTNTLRRSSAIETAHWLRNQGAHVVAWDPMVTELPTELVNVMTLTKSIPDALKDASAVLVATEWPELRSLTGDDLVCLMERPIVLDPGYFLEKRLGFDDRIRYYAVGRSV